MLMRCNAIAVIERWGPTDQYCVFECSLELETSHPHTLPVTEKRTHEAKARRYSCSWHPSDPISKQQNTLKH